VLREIDALAQEYQLQVANVFHAGDGNLHPLVCYDSARDGEAARAEELAGLIVRACVDAGGSITGEHGVGVDKKGYMPEMDGRQGQGPREDTSASLAGMLAATSVSVEPGPVQNRSLRRISSGVERWRFSRASMHAPNSACAERKSCADHKPRSASKEASEAFLVLVVTQSRAPGSTRH
jgi:FAD linked oxidases, C-terminal domain